MTDPAIPPEERPFLDAVLANPDDDEPRLVYADWLADRGDERAGFLRAEVSFVDVDVLDAEALAAAWSTLRDARVGLDDDWIVSVMRILVENCPNDDLENEYEFDCPRGWHRMDPGYDPQLRFCDTCDRQVFFCTTMDEARTLRSANHVIAVDPTCQRTSNDVFDEAFVRIPAKAPAEKLRGFHHRIADVLDRFRNFIRHPTGLPHSPGPIAFEEDSFLAAIIANPNDDNTRIVYADWLDERGDVRGEWMRNEVRLHRLFLEERECSMEVASPSITVMVDDEEWAAAVARPRMNRLLTLWASIVSNRIEFVGEREVDQLGDVDRAVLFVMAFWSGPAFETFHVLGDALSRYDAANLVRLIVVDIDEALDLRDRPALRNFVFGGNGETFFISHGEVLASANFADRANIRDHVLNLVSRGSTDRASDSESIGRSSWLRADR